MTLGSLRRASAPLIFSIALCSAYFSYGDFAHAQVVNDTLSISVNPQTPGAGEQTTITVSSSYFDAGQADFVWNINGAPVASSGAGAKSITFTMGPVGKSTIVSLYIRPGKGEPISRTFTFRPGEVTLLWEASTYVPPFYKGKSLYSAGANIKVMALTNIVDSAGKPIQSSDLNFKWQRNGTAFADRSGVGKNTFEFAGNMLGGGEEVSVDVLRRDGQKAGRGYVEIQNVEPMIVFYKKDPLRGTLYARALTGQISLNETETTIVAEPYYMSGESRNQTNFQHEWLLNGKAVTPVGTDPLVLTLRQTSVQTGTASLEFTVQNTDASKILQQATAVITLILGGAKTDFFGI